MKNTLRAGISRREAISVDDERTIRFLGEAARVYSTPSMVNDVEYVCFRLIEEHLDVGGSSVGIHVEVEHLAGTPLGEQVTVEIEVCEVDGRRIHMKGRIHDRLELIGRANHTRFVIDVEKHADKLREKFDKLTASK